MRLEPVLALTLPFVVAGCGNGDDLADPLRLTDAGQLQSPAEADGATSSDAPPPGEPQDAANDASSGFDADTQDAHENPLPDAGIDARWNGDSAAGWTDFACLTDDLSGFPGTGTLSLDGLGTVVPLCSGWILHGDRTAKDIKLRHVTSGVTHRYPLTSAPGDIAIDSVHGLLLATLSSATSVARIKLRTHAQDTIEVGAAVLNLAVAVDARFFGTTGNSVVLIDASQAALLRSYPSAAGSLIAYDGLNRKLFVAQSGLSPSKLTTFLFDSTALSLAAGQTIESGSNGMDLALSPEGRHLAFACGGGNGGYTIYDYKASDLPQRYGDFPIGAYPQSAAFSLDGLYFASSNGQDVKVYDVATHASVRTFAAPGCEYGGQVRVRFSRGLKTLYAFRTCGFDHRGGQLSWYSL